MVIRSFRKYAGKAKERLLLPYYIVDSFERVLQRIEQLERRIRYLQEALGRVESRQRARVPARLSETEFRVYSQWGEDGIIDYLCQQVDVGRRVFVEFGVENYQEANTRFLLINRNWSGLVLDGSEWHIQQIRSCREYWLYGLKAAQAFITRENINEVLVEQGITGRIGLLSIDVDGMDYWIWDAITVIDPAIVVIEYNYRFGRDRAVTVPYDPAFERRKAHPSILYYGASLKALCRLAERKGYAFVGAGSAGLNAFFVRRDVLPPTLRELTPEEGFVEGQFCEAHDAGGHRVEMSNEEQQRLIYSLPLIDLDASPPGSP